MFKLTTYNERYVICNALLELDGKSESFGGLRPNHPPAPEQEVNINGNINFLVNNLLLKQIMAAKESSLDFLQKLLISMSQVIMEQSRAEISSTQRLARILIYLAILFFDTVPANVEAVNKRAKFLMGTLFQLGGCLKVEARNYLETK
jgi:hypothetical protein